jgi:protein involved in polysaccharide export with SLBB domain
MLMPSCISLRRAATVLVLCLLAGRPPLAAQIPGAAYATRERLEEELARLGASTDKDSVRAADLIRARLQAGDFQSGDRIFLSVVGEPQLTDTFTVGPGPELDLPQVGALPLGGVLRAELPERLQTHLGRYLRDPVVQIKPLMRFLVAGEVARPGFYGVTPLQPFSDLINAAGLTPKSDPGWIRVERDRTTILDGPKMQLAMSRGDSFDSLNLRAGDRVYVPARRDIARTVGILAGIAAIALSIYYIGGHHY